jgi:hypothetical protein
MMADMLLLVLVLGVVALALGLDFAVVVAWLQSRWRSARR